ncbi:hypothetical protein LPB79_21355 [Rhizobium sp. T136]|uniref:hypothetical protein n=1 Tax=Rhizobium sp. T136 TaxID=555319 RepID=UPI001E339378|nr:hypothetical protein [Rhizobium sp. T136]UFS80894.1 hypothetical protein LPB79_21355 [Rhizobium sp. T136]
MDGRYEPGQRMGARRHRNLATLLSSAKACHQALERHCARGPHKFAELYTSRAADNGKRSM